MSMNNKWKLVSREHTVEGDKSSFVLRETHEMSFGSGHLVRETYYAEIVDENSSVSIVFVPGAL